MEPIAQIAKYIPQNDQEAADQAFLLDFARKNPADVLLRENRAAHITSSGFIMNEGLDKVLLIHHNIRDTWAWTGGHADGDSDLLRVALKEAREETGVSSFRPLSGDIASIDILTVNGHYKNGAYVNAHLHLSIAYLLICDEGENLRVKPDENSGVRWFSTEMFTPDHFAPGDVYLYNKLIGRAKRTR